ncbi:hypothetical protein [Nocardia harenae]|nr:hypothetical protein [Nocardia harenae]
MTEWTVSSASRFPVSSTLLLVVTSTPGVSLGRCNAAAKRVLGMLLAPTH